MNTRQIAARLVFAVALCGVFTYWIKGGDHPRQVGTARPAGADDENPR